MLVLTRKLDEQILIGDDIKVTLIRVRGNTVRLGIEAPKNVRIVRGELNPLNEASSDNASEGELTEREHAFAHPALGKVNLPTRGTRKSPAKIAAKRNASVKETRQPSRLSLNVDRIAAEVNSEVFVGTVKASGDQASLERVKIHRAPLANFVSAS
jgi:carbon storage regulator CsrA